MSDYFGKETPKLGFGLMRLPKKGLHTDIEQVKHMVDLFIVRVVMLGMTGNAFTWQMFMAGAFLNAVPGIILQLVFIPALMVALNKTGLVRFQREQKAVVRVVGK